MFGLAAWDRRDGSLLLARDRAGEKPLFYAELGGEVWFASEVQALLEHPEVSRDLDPVALSQYLTLGYVLEPRTMFKAVRRIPAGTFVRFDRDGRHETRYWDPGALATAPRRAAGSPVERVAELFKAAVGKQVMSDVPVGVFTSGGLDSSLLAVLAAGELGPDRVHTFAVRFAAPSYDESAGARWFAERFGTRYVEVVADETTLGEALEKVTAGLAEPLADPAVLPTFLLARAAREHVTVILSGEGADELFGGYPTYLGHQAARWLGRFPRPLRRLAAAAVERIPPSERKVTLEYLLKRFFAELEKPWGERHLAWFGSGLAARLGVSGDEWRRRPPRRLPGDRPARRSHAPRLLDLPARRPAGQGGPGDDAQLDRGAGALPRPRPDRLRAGPAGAAPGAPTDLEVGAQAGRRALAPQGGDPQAQAGAVGAGGVVDQRRLARRGRPAARPRAPAPAGADRPGAGRPPSSPSTAAAAPTTPGRCGPWSCSNGGWSGGWSGRRPFG